MLCRWAWTFSHESPQPRSIRGHRADPPVGDAGGPGPPEKKISNFFLTFLKNNFFFIKTVWYIPKNNFIEIGLKKYFGYIFPQFKKKILNIFFKKTKFLYGFFFRLTFFWNACSINIMVGSFWGRVIRLFY